MPDLVGLIPAHAGKTDGDTLDLASILAHPRSRGENGVEDVGVVGDAGSSPLTRGKHATQEVARVHGRLIPAHAGKTTPCACLTRWPTAHPRSRGENHYEE